jgi:membrane protein implicated in regulation of membrane protease activity
VIEHRSGQEESMERAQAADLTAELARRLSTLVRRDLEVAAAERLPTLRRALLDALASALAVLAAMFAVAALAVAAGLGAANALPGWAAALLVAGLFALLATVAAAVLIRPRAQPKEREELLGLLQMLSRNHRLDELRASREDARAEAEADVRGTSTALVEALLDAAAEHQLRALPEVARREIEKAEADAADLLSETFALVTAPARAGLHALNRLVEPPSARRPPERTRTRSSG